MTSSAPSGAPVAITICALSVAAATICALSVAAAICAAIFVPTVAAPAAPDAPSASAPEIAAAKQTLQVALSSADALAAQAADDVDGELRAAIETCASQADSSDLAVLRACEQDLLSAIAVVQTRL